eukprot:357628-Chlamydomonas_euryale.AAC.2
MPGPMSPCACIAYAHAHLVSPLLCMRTPQGPALGTAISSTILPSPAPGPQEQPDNSLHACLPAAGKKTNEQRSSKQTKRFVIVSKKRFTYKPATCSPRSSRAR